MFQGVKVLNMSGPFEVLLPASTESTVVFDTADFDTNEFFNIGDPTHIVIPPRHGGRYIVGASAFLIPTSGAGTQISIFIRVNDVFLHMLIQPTTTPSHIGTVLQGETIVELAGSDTLVMVIKPGPESDVNLLQNQPYTPAMWIGKW